MYTHAYPHNLKIIHFEQQFDSKDTVIVFFILKNIISLSLNHSCSQSQSLESIPRIIEIRIIVQFLSKYVRTRIHLTLKSLASSSDSIQEIWAQFSLLWKI